MPKFVTPFTIGFIAATTRTRTARSVRALFVSRHCGHFLLSRSPGRGGPALFSLLAKLSKMQHRMTPTQSERLRQSVHGSVVAWKRAHGRPGRMWRKHERAMKWVAFTCLVRIFQQRARGCLLSPNPQCFRCKRLLFCTMAFPVWTLFRSSDV